MTIGGYKSWLVTGIVALALSGAVLTKCARWLSIDPLDRFEVVGVATDAGTGRHAVAYRYHHADSSSNNTAVWILLGTPPAIGSTAAVTGRPVLIWLGQYRQMELIWRSDNRRLLVQIDPPVAVKDLNRSADCYFESQIDVVCIDPHHVDVLHEPPRKP